MFPPRLAPVWMSDSSSDCALLPASLKPLTSGLCGARSGVVIALDGGVFMVRKILSGSTLGLPSDNRGNLSQTLGRLPLLRRALVVSQDRHRKSASCWSDTGLPSQSSESIPFGTKRWSPFYHNHPHQLGSSGTVPKN